LEIKSHFKRAEIGFETISFEFIHSYVEPKGSADFFPGKFKIFQRGQKRLKMAKNIFFFKIKKHTILAGQGGPAGWRGASAPSLS